MDRDAQREQLAPEAAHTDKRTPGERGLIVVPIGSGEFDFDLVLAGQRLGKALRAAWVVVNVETSRVRLLPHHDREQRAELLRLAESLGAESVTLQGASFVKTIASYARLRRADKVLVGLPPNLGCRGFIHLARFSTLHRLMPEMELIVVAATASPGSAPRSTRSHSRSIPVLIRVRRYLSSLAITASCTLIGLPMSGHINLINIGMLYMLGAALAGLLLGRGPSALTALLNILAFDFFFVPPRYSLAVLDPSYLITFSAMLMVGLVIANLMIALREQTAATGARVQHAEALYAITRDLVVSREADAMIMAAVRHIGEAVRCHAKVLLYDDTGQLTAPAAAAGSQIQQPGVNPVAASWVANRCERAGIGTAHFPAERARYLPLRGSRTTLGVLVVEGMDPSDARLPEQRRLLDAIADQLALALERACMSQRAHQADLAAERAYIRNTLLASISHDLRTPLSAIAGAGSMVAQRDFALDLHRRVTLGRLIEEKARDMTDLLTNVLELVRLDSDARVLNKESQALADIVTLALQRHESRLAGWHLSTDIASDLPPLWVDINLMVQLLGNLLENAIRHTPPGTHIRISAYRRGSVVYLVVEDSGPGFGALVPELLFEKFVKGRVEGGNGSVGLGLAICRLVARLHGGDIRATSQSGTGARFEIALPISPAPVDADPRAWAPGLVG